MLVKIPPRTMFYAQFFAVVWLSIVQIATYNFLRGNIKEVCTAHQPQGITCPNAKTFFNASVIWGVVGPKRMFSAGALYSKHQSFPFHFRICCVVKFSRMHSFVASDSAANTPLPRLDQLLLVDRRCPTCHPVFRCPAFPPWNLPISVLPSYLRRRRPDPSGDMLVPRAMGYRGTYLQLLYSQSVSGLVE